MPVFVWEGRVGNDVKKGEMEAPTKSAVMIRLRQRKIRPIPSKIKKKGRQLNLNINIGGVPEKDVVVFTRQLSTMIDSGLPLVRSLDVLATQQKNKIFRHSITQTKESIEGGLPFSDALAKHPKIFSNLYVSLVRAGEEGGLLATILERLADYLEKMHSIKGKIRGAMVYPAIVASVAVIAVIVILIYVVPVFAEMFKDMGTSLPMLTQTIVDISSFVKDYIFYVAVASALLWMAIIFSYRRYEKIRRLFDALLLKMFLIGNLIHKIIMARFCRTLASLTSSGIPILEGLKITASASGNKIVEESILRVRQGISRGEELADPLEREPKIFPSMVTQMISVGEQTGALDDMLNKIADFYEDEVDTAVSAFTSAIEPIMMVFVGLLVGTIVIAMYLPMFKLISDVAG